MHYHVTKECHVTNDMQTVCCTMTRPILPCHKGCANCVWYNGVTHVAKQMKPVHCVDASCLQVNLYCFAGTNWLINCVMCMLLCTEFVIYPPPPPPRHTLWHNTHKHVLWHPHALSDTHKHMLWHTHTHSLSLSHTRFLSWLINTHILSLIHTHEDPNEVRSYGFTCQG